MSFVAASFCWLGKDAKTSMWADDESAAQVITGGTRKNTAHWQAAAC